MNPFNEELKNMMNDIFEDVQLLESEKKSMQDHWNNSKYSRLHIVKVWRGADKILCVQYDDKTVCKYK